MQGTKGKSSGRISMCPFEGECRPSLCGGGGEEGPNIDILLTSVRALHICSGGHMQAALHALHTAGHGLEQVAEGFVA